MRGAGMDGVGVDCLRTSVPFIEGYFVPPTSTEQAGTLSS